MVRTVIGSVVGAGVGFVMGLAGMSAIVGVMEGGDRDARAVCVFVGVFLAGAGAIAGAVIGGVADLLGYWRRKDREVVK
jgi:hypothetical protein